MFRKELPYNIEIAPRKDRVGLVCQTEWFSKDLKVQYRSADGQLGKVILPGNLKEIVIDGLYEGNEYELIITRNDLKGLRYKPKIVKVFTGNMPYVVLVGASVGYAWDLPNLPKRLKNDTFVMGYRRGKEGFDKTKVLKKLLDSKNRPDAIILKECAAYFPRNVEKSLEQISDWIGLLKKEKIIPILATVAPVTYDAEARRPGIQKSINEFNMLLRYYANDNEIALLDLQKALEDGTENHFQQREYALPDGLHLKEQTYYNILDPLVIPILSRLFPGS